MTEVLGLRFFIRQLVVPRDEKLRPQESYAFRAMRLGILQLIRQIYISSQRDMHAIDGHRWLRDGLFEPGGELAPGGISPLSLRHLFGCGVHQHRAASPVQDDFGPGPDPRDGAAQSEDRRNADRVRENRGVGRARSLFADQPDDLVAVELDRQPGG